MLEFSETRSLKVPEDSVLSHSEITLPYMLVGDDAYPLTYLPNETVQQNNIRQK